MPTFSRFHAMPFRKLDKGYAEGLLAQAGANLIYEAAGMHVGLLGFCFEFIVTDMIGGNGRWLSVALDLRCG